MNATDTLLDRVTAIVLDHANTRAVRPGRWVAQISLHYETGIVPHALTLVPEEDPIARLAAYGRTVDRPRQLRFVVVVAESVGDELMVACADPQGGANIAYLRHDGRWALRSKHYCARFDAAKLDQHPAMAIVRGALAAGSAASAT